MGWISLPPGILDETSHVYGVLKVIEYAGNDGHANWLCECASGQAKCRGRIVVRGSELRARHRSVAKRRTRALDRFDPVFGGHND